jgi:hypothetical protein
MEETNEFKVQKLTTDNHYEWKFNMKMVLIGKDLWEIVEGTEVMPASGDNRQAAFRKRENKALSLICLSISPGLQVYVRSAKTAKQAWDSLAKRFEEKTLTRIISYRRQLYAARMAPGSSMIDHVNNLKTLSERLESLDDAVVEKDLVMILISSLPESYNHVHCSLLSMVDLLSSISLQE